MRVLQINKFFFLKGGSERHFFDLSELLSENGHQVFVWSTKHPRNFSFPNQELFAHYNDFSEKKSIFKKLFKAQRILWNHEARKKLEKVIQNIKPDIAHLHNISTHFSPSIIFALKKYNIPIVMTLHDYKLFCPNYKFFSNGKICYDCLKNKNYNSCLSKKCIKNSWIQSLGGYLEGKWHKDFLKVAEKIDIFLAPSLFMRNKAIAWGIPSKKVIHLPNFIDKDYIDIDKNQKNKKQDNYFLYFGRLSHEKGIEFLIKSFLNISDKLPAWKLKIAGDGPERKKLKDLIQEDSPVELLGRKNKKQLKEIIINAYLTIIPSLWPENFPYSALESSVLAKPILGSSLGGLSEMIKDKETGLLFKSNNQNDLEKRILWAVKNPNKIRQMGKSAQIESLAKYNSDKYYEKIIKIYAPLVEFRQVRQRRTKKRGESKSSNIINIK